MERAMGFAALAMLTVFPLLIVVAAAGAATHHGVAVWVVYGMGLNGSSARAVTQLFSAPTKVLSTTSAFSLALTAVFGVSFAGSVQGGFERIWSLPSGPWHKIWRQAGVADRLHRLYLRRGHGGRCDTAHVRPRPLAGSWWRPCSGSSSSGGGFGSCSAAG